MIAFAFFVWFCMKYVWPPLTAALAERQKKIADGLEAADKAERDLEQAQVQVSEQLKEAKTTASGILDQANKRASQIVDEAKEQEQLRSQVASIAIAGAEKILEASIDESAHAELAEKLAASL